MLNAIIIDDKIINAETLEIMLRQYCPTVTVVATATAIDEACLLIYQYRPDLIFLDIELYGGTGFDLLRKFKEIFFETIFTTAYDQYALQAFREQAVDYLLKPINIVFLQEAVSKAERQIRLKRQGNSHLMPAVSGKISLPSQDGYLFVDPREIIRCEASGSYTVFHLAGGRKVMVSIRLKICESRLSSGLFCRIHHSHIININFVNKYFKGKGGYVVLTDGTEVEVSTSRKEAFLGMMHDGFEL